MTGKDELLLWLSIVGFLGFICYCLHTMAFGFINNRLCEIVRSAETNMGLKVVISLFTIFPCFFIIPLLNIVTTIPLAFLWKEYKVFWVPFVGLIEMKRVERRWSDSYDYYYRYYNTDFEWSELGEKLYTDG